VAPSVELMMQRWEIGYKNHREM